MEETETEHEKSAHKTRAPCWRLMPEFKDKEVEKWLTNLGRWELHYEAYYDAYHLTLVSHFHLPDIVEPIQEQLISPSRLVGKSVALMFGILEFLSIEGPNTPYQMSKTLTVRISSLMKCVHKLHTDGFIRVVEKCPWRTGLERKLYGITSTGLVPVLLFRNKRTKSEFTINQYPGIQRWSEEKARNNYFSTLVQKNAHLPLYDIVFQNWQLIEECERESKLSLIDGLFEKHALLKSFENINRTISLLRSTKFFYPRYEHGSKGTIVKFSSPFLRKVKHVVTCEFLFDILSSWEGVYIGGHPAAAQSARAKMDSLRKNPVGMGLYNKWKEIFPVHCEILDIRRALIKAEMELLKPKSLIWLKN